MKWEFIQLDICPVLKVVEHRSADGDGTGFIWDVHKARGVLATGTVIHCTNVYAGFLLPQLRQFVTLVAGELVYTGVAIWCECTIQC
jgi:glycine/D-amino acid oxidase-like deaminating enzyme